jgi:hypothetical protein
VGEELASIPNFGIEVKYQTKPKEIGVEVIFLPKQ